MTDGEVRDRLIELSMTLRVWPGDMGAENLTLGLIELCEDWVRPGQTVAEVGCFAGVSTEVFALFTGPTGLVVAVDPWEVNPLFTAVDWDMIAWARRTFHRRVQAVYSWVRVVGKPSALAAPGFTDGAFDLVYIDGDHAPGAIALDLSLWLPKVKGGGILAGHDYGLVKPLLDAVGLVVDRTYSDTSWVLRKKS